jgi:hypothetical protein
MIVVVKAHDIILAWVVAALHLDQFKIDLAWVLSPFLS